jgi:hypothetical protein
VWAKVWAALAAVIGSLILVVFGGAVSALFTWRAASVAVYRLGEDRLYYEFWSAQYQESLDNDDA